MNPTPKYTRKRSSFSQENQGMSLILSILFPRSSLTNENRMIASEKEFDHYTEQILSKKLETLVNDQLKLKQEAQAINDQLYILLSESFSETLDSHNVSMQVREKITVLQDLLVSIDDKIQLNQQNLTKFTAKIPALSSLMIQADVTAKYTKSVSNVIYLVLLLDELIDQGYYDEGIDLILFSRKIISKTCKSCAFMARFSEICQEKQQKMVTQLEDLLLNDNTLSTLLRVVGYYRRLGAYTELDLRLAFLKAKSTLLTSLTDVLQDHQLKQWIDSTREKLFELVTQYNAVFNDSSNHQYKSQLELVLPWFLHTWFSEHLLPTLQKSEISDFGSFQSIYSQLMYFGLSCGRIGFDFRHHVSPFVESRVISICNSMFDSSIAAINAHINAHDINLKQPRDDSDFGMTSFANTTVIAPPSHALDFVFNCVLINEFLSVFNQLRLAPLEAFATEQYRLLVTKLQLVSHTVIQCITQSEFMRQFKDYVIPFLLKCFLQGIYRLDLKLLDSGLTEIFKKFNKKQ